MELFHVKQFGFDSQMRRCAYALERKLKGTYRSW